MFSGSNTTGHKCGNHMTAGIKAETSKYTSVQGQTPGTPSNDPSAPAALRFRVAFVSALISWYNSTYPSYIQWNINEHCISSKLSTCVDP